MRRSVRFTAERTVEVRDSETPSPGPGEVLVETELSAISPGTELLVYRGEADRELPADETIDAIEGTFDYPLSYGYAAVGRVAETGGDVEEGLAGRRVFAFHPHESAFLADPADLVAVPEDCPAERAAMLANVETAVNLAMDGRPRIGEQAVVFGQGVVGLLTAGVLSSFPLSALVAVEPHERRRERARRMGATAAVHPDDLEGTLTDEDTPDGADLVYELSGNPAGLDAAIGAAGYAGRVIIGSWYGHKPVELGLGGEFHRSHVRLQVSQVSRIDHEHAGRWDKRRRLATARGLLAELEPERLVTHRLSIGDAADAYRLLDSRPQDACQVLLTY
jgi:alcohol dehydrogenase